MSWPLDNLTNSSKGSFNHFYEEDFTIAEEKQNKLTVPLRSVARTCVHLVFRGTSLGKQLHGAPPVAAKSNGSGALSLASGHGVGW